MVCVLRCLVHAVAALALHLKSRLHIESAICTKRLVAHHPSIIRNLKHLSLLSCSCLPECVEGRFSELRMYGVLRSSHSRIDTWDTKIIHLRDAPCLVTRHT